MAGRSSRTASRPDRGRALVRRSSRCVVRIDRARIRRREYNNWLGHRTATTRGFVFAPPEQEPVRRSHGREDAPLLLLDGSQAAVGTEWRDSARGSCA